MAATWTSTQVPEAGIACRAGAVGVARSADKRATRTAASGPSCSPQRTPRFQRGICPRGVKSKPALLSMRVEADNQAALMDASLVRLKG